MPAKVFEGDSALELQDKLNSWLHENPDKKIRYFAQSESSVSKNEFGSDSHITATMLYE